jgi:hypothetical protein
MADDDTALPSMTAVLALVLTGILVMIAGAWRYYRDALGALYASERSDGDDFAHSGRNTPVMEVDTVAASAAAEEHEKVQ